MKFQNQEGMTLLEILVVMLIFGVLVGMGYSSILGYRNSIEFNSATQEFESFIQSIENMARNNVLLNTDGQENILDYQLDGYLVNFNYNDEKNISVFSCEFNMFTRTYSCTSIPLEPKYYPNIQLNKDNNDSCNGIYFKTLSSDMKIYGTGTTNYVGTMQEIDIRESTCRIKILNTTNQSKYSREYYFDSNLNSYVKI